MVSQTKGGCDGKATKRNKLLPLPNTVDIKKQMEEMAYATIGLATMGMEFAQKTLEEAATRGREAMSQCKVKNEELQRKVKETLSDIITVTVQTGSDESTDKPTVDDVMAQVDKMTEEEKAALLAKLTANKTAATDNAEQATDPDENKDNEPTT